MGDTSDRTIPATPRRRELARRRGFMPTAALPAWVATVATTLLLLPAWARATATAAEAFVRRAAGFTAADMAVGPGRDLLPPADLVLPTVAMVLVAAAVGLAVRMLLDGPSWQPARVLASFDRIDPLGGLARIFSMATLASLAGHAAGLGLLVAAAVVASGPLVRLIGAGGAPPVAADLAAAVHGMLLPLVAAAAVVAAATWGWARLRFERRIRMTPEEYAEEARSLRADPRVRGAGAGPGRRG